MKNMMKKNCLFLLAAFAAVILSLTACSSSDEADLTTPEQPTEPDADRGVVKTEFTISVPQNLSALRRLSANTVQQSGGFRGISNIYLYPLSDKVSGEFPKISTTIPSAILLLKGTASTIGPSGSTDNTIESNAIFETSKSHLYQDVDIPIGTKSFMFYGVATPGEGGNAVNGALQRSSTSSETNLGGITFSPVPIYSSESADANATRIANYLTLIANAKVDADHTWENSPNVGLRYLYEQFTSIKSGAWASVKGAVKALYDNMAYNETSVDTQETKDMKDAIRAAITNSDYGVSVSGGTLVFANTTDDYPEKNSYPSKLDLPDGAAYVLWNKDITPKAFEVKLNNENTGMNIPTVAKFVYPASLYYRVLSNIKTSMESKGTTVYNNNAESTWSKILSYYEQTAEEEKAEYDNTAVSSKTRSIVITDPVQYAVGKLDAVVTATSSSLSDNDPTHSFTVNTGTLFPVTGILVGGQKAVDYKFEPKGDDYYTIYDHSVTSGVYLTNYAEGDSKPIIHTLALETKKSTGSSDDDAKVKIAVEFLNNSGITIKGHKGEMIYDGCKFYLIGTLDPSTNTMQNYEGTSTKINQAFVQDYTTTLTLKIKDLKNAYNTLPDLTIPKLEMGLSIDLGWKTGIIDSIDME